MSAKQKLVPYVHTDGQEWDHYFFDPRSQIIYFLKSHNGKKIKFSTKEKIPNGLKAKRYANAEFDRRTGKRKAHVRTLIKEELAAWELLKESEGHKYDTMNNIRRARKQIEEFWGDRLPPEITRDTLAEWYAWWRANHPDIQIENAVKYMRNFARYLHEKVVNDRPLLASVPKISDPNRKAIRAKRAKKKERVLTGPEFKQIHSTAANSIEALVAHIMYTMATRIDETLKLDFRDKIRLDEEVPVYRWNVGETKAEALEGRHALHLSLLEPLRELRVQRRAERTTLLFPQKINNQAPLREQQIDWDAWRKRADLEWHWTPHTFRHTCLTNLFNDPRNPHAVICKQYRVSLGVALETYVKVTREAMLSIRDTIEVSL